MSEPTNDYEISALLWLLRDPHNSRHSTALRLLVAERDALKNQRDKAVWVLKEIANQDYRGHPSRESQIAMDALAAMRKGEA